MPLNPGSAGGKALNQVCIVCKEARAGFFANVEGLDYRRCEACQATFLNPAQRLPAKETYARYCRHQNHPEDPRYRQFLSKLARPVLKRLPTAAKGLDYGCGPGPALACMLREAGHRMSLFDLYFYPDPKPLEGRYDFITCTETVEHFHRPAEEFARFDQMLRPGGWLAIMTTFQTDDDRFASWHYRRDPTHVVFYRDATLRYIARQFGYRCEIPVSDVALMQKPDGRMAGRAERYRDFAKTASTNRYRRL
jgi:SAM-dependent methyltransferase